MKLLNSPILPHFKRVATLPCET